MKPLPGISRQAFVGRIRAALGRSSPPAQVPEPPAVDDALARLTGADEDLPALFADRARKLGASVHPCSIADLSDTLTAVLGEHEATSVTLAEAQLPDGPAIAETLAHRGVAVREWRDDREMAAHYEVDAGVTGCHAAFAETGTIVYRSGEGGGRGHMLVPPVHVAVVRQSQILPDMLDYMNAQHAMPQEQVPASQSFVSGPSKTADIEGVLITGVHGPGKLAILLVEDA